MDANKFQMLENVRYVFKTYYGETLYGIPYSPDINEHYLIYPKRINDFNENLDLKDEEKVKEGIITPINPDVIDDFRKY